MKENRVEKELLKWKSKESRFAQLFNFEMATNRGFQQEKLRDFQRILSKFKATVDPDERFAIQMLRQEKKQLEKQLFPNFLQRAIVRLIYDPLRQYFKERQKIKTKVSNRQNVFWQMQRIGMQSHFHKVEKILNKDKYTDFSVPISYQVGENDHVEHLLLFKSNGMGTINLISDKVTLVNEINPSLSRSYTFEIENNLRIQPTEAYNLLHGRAVAKFGKWISLDFNDRDIAGNYRMKIFPTTYDFNLERSLKDIGVQELKDVVQKEKVINALCQGDKVPVTIRRKTFFVEANPQFRTINIYDKEGQKVSVGQVHRKRIHTSLKQEANQALTIRKNGLRMS